jgi:iron uptake system component EfeO
MRRTSLLVATLVGAAMAAACTSTAAPPGIPGRGGPITVTSSDTGCELSATTAPAGVLSFTVQNTGTKVTEFYLYGTGDRIVGEVENVGPGTTRTLTTQVPQVGAYTTACKPGMVGEGVRAPFAVTGDAGPALAGDAALATAVSGYQRYVVAQVDAQVTTTGQFADAVRRGDVPAAQALYPRARTYWERIEPVAESFGDIDPRIDGREDDQRDPGVPWTGYHRLEKDLWVTGLQPDSGATADRLVADVGELRGRVATVQLTGLQLANGAKELLDEVATRKITGEEDRYSHTDLDDFRGNIDGSQAAISALRPVIDVRDPALGPALDDRFADVDQLLEAYRVGDGFRLYTSLTADDTRRMTSVVDALSEPVSQVAGVVAA